MDQAEAVQPDLDVEETIESPGEVVEESQQEITDEAVEGETEVTEEPEFVEVEFDGMTYQVPPELKDAVMMHADYTQKTQGLSEERKAFEAQQQALEQNIKQFQQAAEQQQMNMQGHAQLAALQNQLAQYDAVNWNEWSENDPQAAQQAFFQYSQLKDATANLSQQISQQEQVALQQQQQLVAKQLEQGKAELERDIPNWNMELANTLTGFGQEQYGFTESQLRSVMDPKSIKVLHDAFLYRQSLKQATEPQKKPVKPGGKVRSKAPVSKDPENMTSEEWLTWRNKQLGY